MRPLPRRRPRWGLLAAAAALVLALVLPLTLGHVAQEHAAALGSGTVPASATAAARSAASPAAPSGPRTASDQGVTADTITVGVAVVDLGIVSRAFGANAKGLSVAAQETAFTAFADDLNARGGIGGRRIRLAFASFNILDTSSQVAACKQLTETDHVFIALSTIGLFGDPILCFTNDHQVPYIANDGAVSSYYRTAQGRLFTLQPSTLRTEANAVWELHATGHLDGKVGFVHEDGYQLEDSRTVAAFLQQVTGHAPVTAVVSSNPAEIGTALGQSRSAAVQLCAAGVTEVLIGVNSLYASQLVDSWKRTTCPEPIWLTSDTQYETAADSFLGDLDESYFAHAFGVTSTIVGGQHSGEALPATDQHCLDVYDHQTRTTLAPDDSGRIIVIAACGVVALAEQGLLRGGTNPTRTTFAAALQHLGAFDNPGFGSSSLRPGKLDAPDQVRLLRADGTCHCWHVAAPFTEAHLR